MKDSSIYLKNTMIRKIIKESITRFNANLEEIMDNNDELGQIYNSREFLTTLFNDLVHNKRNVIEWKVMGAHNGSEDASLYDDSAYGDFKVDYDFDFVYNYKGKQLKLTMLINGNITFTQGKTNSGDRFTPPSGGEMNIDQNSLGNDLDLTLFDNEGKEVSTTWLTPDLKKKVIDQVMKDYV